MNELNLPEPELPEEQLQSWQPRRPSAGIKRRILSRATESSTRATRWVLGTLTPTIACLLLTLTMLNSGNNLLRSNPEALIFNSQTNASGNNDNGQTVQNQLASVTFDWTNHSSFNSSIRFTPSTNSSN